MSVVAIFHDVRSAHNVGSLFRTADGAGISKIYLTGYTPAPRDRFGREDASIAKTALGAEKHIQWEKGEVSEVISKLKEEGYAVVGVEQTAGSLDYRTYNPSEKTAYIFGNEVGGLSQGVLAQCDVVVEIPMNGKKESLNVSVAAGIILFRLADKLN